MFSLAFHLLVCFAVLLRDVTASDHDCQADPTAMAYRGNLSVSISGLPCKKWTDSSFLEVPSADIKMGVNGLGDHNYCRHVFPDIGITAWCFTDHENKQSEYCALGVFAPECRRRTNDPKECYVTTPAFDYRGTMNVTRNGLPCQSWSDQAPHEHDYTPENYPNAGLGDHNYCRNPTADLWMTWCYTTSDQTEWDFCNIGVPSPSCTED